jgi:hypothetical protein
MKLDKNKLETTLISNWTSFINAKEIINFISNHLNVKITFVTISKFELTNLGFILWVDYKNDQTYGFVEILIDLNCDLFILQ